MREGHYRPQAPIFVWTCQLGSGRRLQAVGELLHLCVKKQVHILKGHSASVARTRRWSVLPPCGWCSQCKACLGPLPRRIAMFLFFLWANSDSTVRRVWREIPVFVLSFSSLSFLLSTLSPLFFSQRPFLFLSFSLVSPFLSLSQTKLFSILQILCLLLSHSFSRVCECVYLFYTCVPFHGQW